MWWSTLGVIVIFCSVWGLGMPTAYSIRFAIRAHSRALALALSVAISLSLAACAHGSYTMLVASRPSPRPTGCSLDVFDSPSEVGRPFKRACLISGESGAAATMDEAMGAIRDNACKCGAQAVLMNQVQSQGNRFSGIKLNLTAYGIVYEEPSTGSSSK
jgi:hypothetical protein